MWEFKYRTSYFEAEEMLLWTGRLTRHRDSYLNPLGVLEIAGRDKGQHRHLPGPSCGTLFMRSC